MPKFSVIIPSVNGLPTIAECLRALKRQKGDVDFEIIVVDRTQDKTPAYIRLNFPEVKLIELDKPLGIPQMRALAMTLARGRYLAIIEDHCIVPENWLEEIAKAHEFGYEVIGGAIENGSTRRLIDWAVFLCEYSSFMPPISSGETDFVTGNNTSYKSSVMEKIDETVKKHYWEYFLQEEIREKGIKLINVPAIVVSHKKEFGFFYFLTQRFHYSRSFAAMRKRKSSVSKQIVFLFYVPFLPVHQTWRIAANVWRKKRNYREFLLSLPLLLIFMSSYALGEFTGYLFGSGRSLQKVE